MNAKGLVKSSPLDGFTNLYQQGSSAKSEANNINQSNVVQVSYSNLNDNQSVLSLDSIATTSRLLDKLELSPEDEVLFQQLIENEKNGRINVNSTSQNNEISQSKSTSQISNIADKQNNNGIIKTNTSYLSDNLSVPASQFPSLRKYHSNNNLNSKLININNIQKVNNSNVMKEAEINFNNNNNNNNKLGNNNFDNNIYNDFNKKIAHRNFKTSIKNILEKDVTFMDNSLASSVEEHYANTTRFSYIVEEDLSENVESSFPNLDAFSIFPDSSRFSKRPIQINKLQRKTNMEETENVNNNENIISNNNTPFRNRNDSISKNENLANEIASCKRSPNKESNNTVDTNNNNYNNNNVETDKSKNDEHLSDCTYSSHNNDNIPKSKSIEKNRNKLYEQINSDDFLKFKQVNTTSGVNNKLKMAKNNNFNNIINTFNNFNNNDGTQKNNGNSNPNTIPNFNSLRNNAFQNNRNPANDEQFKNIAASENRPSHHYYRNIALGKCNNKESLCKSNSLKDDCNVERNESYGSTNSRNTQFSSNTQFTNKFTQMTNESDLTYESPIAKSEFDNLLTPDGKTASIGRINLTPMEDINHSPSLSFKTHKKESSLSSLKNLFKTPKNKEKSKKLSTNSITNMDTSYDTHVGSNSSFDSIRQNSFIESSPSIQNKKKMSKLIFSPHPVLYSNSVAQKSTDGSLLGQTSSRQTIYDSADSLHYNSNNQGYHQRSRSDFQSSVSPPSLSTSKHSRNKSLQMESPEYGNTNYASQMTTDLDHNYFNHNLISSAIDMRKAGKLEASANKLYHACKTGNHTAFLLYGLALRYGYGVDIDLSKSLEYLKVATGLTNLDQSVFGVSINPFELERHPELIPQHISEPFVPAIHECGISYLKDFGNGKTNEWKGLKFLEKAASLGHVDSMCLSGIIWSQDDAFGITNRKKDLIKAATWFRIADSRGANLIGSDWIFKKKYTKAANKRLE